MLLGVRALGLRVDADELRVLCSSVASAESNLPSVAIAQTTWLVCPDAAALRRCVSALLASAGQSFDQYCALQMLNTGLVAAPDSRLLGDAAHPMMPNLGQGGGMAIEDALVLGQDLRRVPQRLDRQVLLFL